MTEVADLKLPPNSAEAEQAVIGGLMLEAAAWDLVADRLSEADFYRQDHRVIFSAIASLHERGAVCDALTVAETLERAGDLTAAGGPDYLAELATRIASAANIVAYADIVRERSLMRELISVGVKISNSGYRPQGRLVDQLVDEAESLVFEIAERGQRRGAGFVSVQQVLPEVMDDIDRMYEAGDAITGLGTGFAELDSRTSGMQRSDLIIVAGRPSMGKTAFSMNLAESVALRLNEPVAVFSMEMSAKQLVLRLIASLARVDAHAVRTGQIGDDDWPRITSTLGLLQEAQLFIDDTPNLTPLELRARARRLKSRHGLGLVLVDYLQLMKGSGQTENRVNEISEISRSLKGLAKELDVPVVALSQLNRSLEQRPNKRPVMSDLRESGAIEQDADLILFIYRDEVYNEDSPDKGTAEVIIAKQRNGPIGTVRLAFLGRYTRFEDLSYADYRQVADEPFG